MEGHSESLGNAVNSVFTHLEESSPATQEALSNYKEDKNEDVATLLAHTSPMAGGLF